MRTTVVRLTRVRVWIRAPDAEIYGVWYAINRRFGRELIVIGVALAVMAAWLDAAGLDTPAGRAIAGIAMIASLVFTTVRGWKAANRTGYRSSRSRRLPPVNRP